MEPEQHPEKKTARLSLKVKPTTRNDLLKEAKRRSRSYNWLAEQFILQGLRKSQKKTR